MPAATATAVKSRYDIDGFLNAIGDVPVTTDTQRVRLRSRDYFWYIAGPQQAAARQVGRRGGDAAQRGGRDPRRRGLREAAHSR